MHVTKATLQLEKILGIVQVLPGQDLMSV
jgi:hypothetical protein